MSIVEVAKEAGVSHATVSYVINGKPGVSSGTAKRVVNAIQKLGYVPGRRRSKAANSPLPLSSLPDSLFLRTGTIGVVFYGREANMVQIPFYARLVHAIEEELSEKNLSMLLVRINKPEGILDEDKMDGAVICGFNSKIMNIVQIPHVSVLGHPDLNEALVTDHIEPANDRIGALAVNYLRERGHRHVAFIDSTYGEHPPIAAR
ncbi:MAG TPA: LacI family DNA-binding transcriptional regulator, partial [Desulfobacterales bacterium]|nr:LacI family DNA-binding transcriptional regulator [Desulfobacterales bacterium]